MFEKASSPARHRLRDEPWTTLNERFVSASHQFRATCRSWRAAIDGNTKEICLDGAVSVISPSRFPLLASLDASRAHEVIIVNRGGIGTHPMDPCTPQPTLAWGAVASSGAVTPSTPPPLKTLKRALRSRSSSNTPPSSSYSTSIVTPVMAPDDPRMAISTTLPTVKRLTIDVTRTSHSRCVCCCSIHTQIVPVNSKALPVTFSPHQAPHCLPQHSDPDPHQQRPEVEAFSTEPHFRIPGHQGTPKPFRPDPQGSRGPRDLHRLPLWHLSRTQDAILGRLHLPLVPLPSGRCPPCHTYVMNLIMRCLIFNRAETVSTTLISYPHARRE